MTLINFINHQQNQFVSSTTGRKYFSIDIKLNEVHCKLQNYTYLLTCTHCGIQYVVESITPLNLRKNIFPEEENQDVKFLLIIIRIFVKVQHFQSKLMKSYQEMVVKIE